MTHSLFPHSNPTQDQTPTPTPTTPGTPDLALQAGLEHMGFTAFRPGQREAIEMLLSEGSLLLVAPTGGGKSLTYQLPAHLLEGTTIVVSPLIALMNDQVQALSERGVPATFLASTLEGGEMGRRMARMREGAYDLVYVSPERLTFEGFRSLVREMDPPLVAVDEAHCISEWGHDFRPEYMRIHEVLEVCPRARVLACTATATPVVRDEIMARLGLGGDTPQMVRGFARPNLVLGAREVKGSKGRRREVDRVLDEALGEPGSGGGAAIIYGPTRRSTETEARRLADRGWRAEPYHAGLGGPRRRRVQEAFLSGELEVVCATNAFGMGIDRADVRAVVHLAPPGSIEAYYQEVGRAGRDGEKAWGLLLTQPRDLPRRRYLIEQPDDDGTPPDPGVVDHKWNLFLELLRWAEGGSCRHDAILRYFGDEEETLSGCGHCDECRRLEDEEQADDPEEVRTYVRKALSAVARIHGRFGLSAARKMLCGHADDRLRRSGLDDSSTHGILADEPTRWVRRLLRRCVTAGWVDFVGGNRPRAVLTEAGTEVMRGEREPRMLLPPRRSRRSGGRGRSSTGRSSSGGGGSPPEEELSAEEAALFEALREHRLEVSRELECPAFIVAHDRTLRDIARIRPGSLAELRQAHGIGPAKAEKHGEGFLEVVARAGGED